MGSQIQGRFVLLLLLTVAICGRASALHSAMGSRPMHRASHHRRFASILYHPLFRPTHESLLRQNEEIERLELPRIQDEAELEELKSSGALLPIRASESLRFDPRLDVSRRFCRPWTRDFVEDLGDAFYKEFHASIQVNSAVRTVEVQHKLRRHNRNAAPESGETGSSHLAGITVDIQRRGLTNEQIRWVEQYMLPLSDQGMIEPEEERHQWVFHVMVSDRYDTWRGSNVVVAASQQQPADNSMASAKVEDITPPQLATQTSVDLSQLSFVNPKQ